MSTTQQSTTITSVSPPQQSIPDYLKWLRDRMKDWHCPCLVYEDDEFVKYGTVYESLACHKMEVKVEFFWGNALVTINGDWNNNLPDNNARDFIFAMNTRGSLTDLTVTVQGSNYEESYIRTIATVNTKTIKEIVDTIQQTNDPNNSNSNDSQQQQRNNAMISRAFRDFNEWTEKEKTIFGSSNESNIFLPLNHILPGDRIHIECEFVETLRLVNHGFYFFRLPLTFYDSYTNEVMFPTASGAPSGHASQIQGGLMAAQQNAIPFDHRVQIQCFIKHASSMNVAEYYSPSHDLTREKRGKDCLSFITAQPVLDDVYMQRVEQNLRIQEGTGGFLYNLLKDGMTDIEAIDDSMSNVSIFGRSFDLFFRFSNKLPVNMPPLSSHMVYNPMRQFLNFKNKNKNKDSSVNGFKHDAVSNVTLFIGADITRNDLIHNNVYNIPFPSRCMYFVVNATHLMERTWDPHIVETIAHKISEFNDNDLWGICVFNEYSIYHYDHTNANDLVYNKKDTKDIRLRTPMVQTPRVCSNAVVKNENGYQTDTEVSEHLQHWFAFRAPYTKRFVYKQVRQEIKARKPSKEEKKELLDRWMELVDTSNVTKSLMETLHYMESRFKNDQTNIFKQIVLVQAGKCNVVKGGGAGALSTQDSDEKEMKTDLNKRGKYDYINIGRVGSNDENEIKADVNISINTATAGNRSNSSNSGNSSTGSQGTNIMYLSDLINNSSNNPMIGGGNVSIVSNGNSNSNNIDEIFESNGLTEAEVFDKIALLYDKHRLSEALQNDQYQCYSTRINTVGLGNSSNLPFLKALANRTRGVATQCFDPKRFKFDLYNFVQSIEIPIFIFDNNNSQDIIECVSEKDDKTGNDLFIFPTQDVISDVYIGRPLMIKLYVNCVNNKFRKLKNIQINGKFTNFANKLNSILTGNTVMNNNEWKMEFLLSNEEINYWHSIYWMKEIIANSPNNNANNNNNNNSNNNNNNNGNNVNKAVSNIPVLSNIGKILSKLSQDTGISSMFGTKISFCETQREYERVMTQLEAAIEEQRVAISQMNASLDQSDDELSDSSDDSSSDGGHFHGNNGQVNLSNAPNLSETANPINAKKLRNQMKVGAVTTIGVVATLGVAAFLNPFGSSSGGGDGFGDLLSFDIDGFFDGGGNDALAVTCECCGEECECAGGGCEPCAECCEDCCVVM